MCEQTINFLSYHTDDAWCRKKKYLGTNGGSFVLWHRATAKLNLQFNFLSGEDDKVDNQVSRRGHEAYIYKNGPILNVFTFQIVICKLKTC